MSKSKGKKVNIVVDSKLHIPIREVDFDYIQKKFTHYDFENSVCAKCEFRSERPSEECLQCTSGGLKEIVSLSSISERKGVQCIAIPYGEQFNLSSITGIPMKKMKLIDKTVKKPFDYKIKFTGELRDYQIPAVDDMIDAVSGLLQSKPRTGKTVMATAAACFAGYRTVFIADQKDFLDGFEETIAALTNLPELEEKHGKKLYGFPKTIADYENFQILLVTYQSLIKDTKVAKSRLKAIQENYGTVCVDETHRANAACFSSIMANMHSFYRWGLTATPKRKDGKHYIIRSIIGPVVASTKAEALKPKYTVHRTTKTVYNRNQYKGKAGWVRFCQFLAKHPDRNDRILEFIIRDLEQGRSVAVPVMFTDHAKLLVKRINEYFGEEVAATFLGGTKEAKKRKVTVDAAREGKIRCIVGIRRLIQIGINIPQWDTLYYIMPMNNEPNWEQESFRILTPLDGKKTPICRLFVDMRMDRSVQCFRAVLKFGEKLGHDKAPLTPKKLRDWLGVVDKEEIYDDALPDYVEQSATIGYRSLGGRAF